MKRVAAIFAILALSGCAASQAEFAGLGVSEAQKVADTNQCANLSRTRSIFDDNSSYRFSVYYQPNLYSSLASLNDTERQADYQRFLFNRCMLDKGYTRAA